MPRLSTIHDGSVKADGKWLRRDWLRETAADPEPTPHDRLHTSGVAGRPMGLMEDAEAAMANQLPLGRQTRISCLSTF